MKHGISLMAGIALLCACNNNPANNSDLNDNLGNKTIDTTGRGDTAYYERMNQKTGAPDTGSAISRPQRSDTAYYERLPNKPPDTSR